MSVRKARTRETSLPLNARVALDLHNALHIHLIARSGAAKRRVSVSDFVSDERISGVIWHRV